MSSRDTKLGSQSESTRFRPSFLRQIHEYCLQRVTDYSNGMYA